MITIKNSNHWFISYLVHQQLLCRDTERRLLNKMVSASVRLEAVFILYIILFVLRPSTDTNTLSQQRNATRTAVCAYVFLFRFPFRTVFTAQTRWSYTGSPSPVDGVVGLRRCVVGGLGGGWWYTEVTSSAVITSPGHDYQNRIVVIIIIIIYMTVAKTRNG